jgi:thiol-disulfide isomerase/thioredoxin
MARFVRRFTAFLLACVTAAAQAAAPEITLVRLFPEQPVKNASLESLRGKFVAIEFWATWCVPCVAEIPRWNALAARFQDRPIQFLSVTREEQGLVQRFLTQHPISGLVGISRGDKNPSTLEEVAEAGNVRLNLIPDMFNRYQIIAIPRTVLIDADGRIMAKLHAHDVDEYILEDLLEGRPIRSIHARRNILVAPK